MQERFEAEAEYGFDITAAPCTARPVQTAQQGGRLSEKAAVTERACCNLSDYGRR